MRDKVAFLLGESIRRSKENTMGNFRESMDKLFKLEFNNPRNFLHKNKTEKGHTAGGIYRHAHPTWKGWDRVDIAMYDNSNNIGDASEELYNIPVFIQMVSDFYYHKFWLKMQLDKIHSQKICDEIFLFGVNSGKRNAIRKAQKLVGVEADGLIGPLTIEALNSCDEDEFDMQFDRLEMIYYADLIEKKPSMAIYQNGWINRANFV